LKHNCGTPSLKEIVLSPCRLATWLCKKVREEEEETVVLVAIVRWHKFIDNSVENKQIFI
jgi:hypothetical protein